MASKEWTHKIPPWGRDEGSDEAFSAVVVPPNGGDRGAFDPQESLVRFGIRWKGRRSHGHAERQDAGDPGRVYLPKWSRILWQIGSRASKRLPLFAVWIPTHSAVA